jgi:putative oxidoreductase
MISIIPRAWTPYLLAVLRIATALLFLQHGFAKLFHAPHVAMFDNLKLFSMMGLAGVLELVGGALLLIGFLTRPVAFILSGEMAVAYFMAHATKSFWPILNQGELAGLDWFVFVFLAAAGPGRFSVDRD